MNISIKHLFGFNIQATDGEIGSLHDVLVDSRQWRARYLVVDTGGWLFGRKVLIAPVAASEPDMASELLPVRLTKQQIKDSPDIASDPPLSREQEIAYNDYFRWPHYWIGGGNVGSGNLDGIAEAPVWGPAIAEDSPGVSALPSHERDYHLRSVRNVIGHTLRRSDEELGEVEDFLLEGSTWDVPYLVAAISEDGGDRRVLIPARMVQSIGWPEQEVSVDLSAQFLAAAPPFDESVLRDSEFLDSVAAYYSRRV
jgi:hypothetical protein